MESNCCNSENENQKSKPITSYWYFWFGIAVFAFIFLAILIRLCAYHKKRQKIRKAAAERIFLTTLSLALSKRKTNAEQHVREISEEDERESDVAAEDNQLQDLQLNTSIVIEEESTVQSQSLEEFSDTDRRYMRTQQLQQQQQLLQQQLQHVEAQLLEHTSNQSLTQTLQTNHNQELSCIDEPPSYYEVTQLNYKLKT